MTDQWEEGQSMKKEKRVKAVRSEKRVEKLYVISYTIQYSFHPPQNVLELQYMKTSPDSCHPTSHFFSHGHFTPSIIKLLSLF